MEKFRIMRYFGAIVMLLLVALDVSGGDGVRVGIAWQPNVESYDRVILSIEQAGGEAVIWAQLRAAGCVYDGALVGSLYVDHYRGFWRS